MEKFNLDAINLDLGVFDLDVLKDVLANTVWRLFHVDITSGVRYLEIQSQTIAEESGVDSLRAELFFFEIRSIFFYAGSVFEFLRGLEYALSYLSDGDMEKMKVKK